MAKIISIHEREESPVLIKLREKAEKDAIKIFARWKELNKMKNEIKNKQNDNDLFLHEGQPKRV